MKSIMEEASSVIKAIEKGWASAGQPKEFTVKIFEESQKNFIGMTVRPAKIGLFFSEAAAPKAQPKRKTKPAVTPRKETPAPADRVKGAKEAPKREPRKEAQQLEQRTGPVWTEEMIASAQEWTTEILKLMDLGHASFTVQPENFHLKMQFAGHLYDDRSREKYFFASLSHIVLTMLKRQYKRPLKGYKIVLLGD